MLTHEPLGTGKAGWQAIRERESTRPHQGMEPTRNKPRRASCPTFPERGVFLSFTYFSVHTHH
jgi:hypothetical protein